MFGIIRDADKLFQELKDSYLRQISYLTSKNTDLERRIIELQDLIFHYTGLISEPQTAADVVANRQLGIPRTAHARRVFLEHRFRPEELENREKEWKRKADEEAKALESETDANPA